MATSKDDSKATNKTEALSGNAPKAADFSNVQTNVGTNSDANKNPAQPSLNQTVNDETVNNPQITPLGPDVGAVKAPTYQSPSVHDLATASVEEAFGPDAHNNPTFNDRVKDVETQMMNTIKRTQGVQMAQAINPDPTGDTPKQVEDKVRDLPANQGLNDWDMWQKIDTEVAAAQTASKLKNNVRYDSGNGGNKHGNKQLVDYSTYCSFWLECYIFKYT